jgi:hypothetical protein
MEPDHKGMNLLQPEGKGRPLYGTLQLSQELGHLVF